MKKIKKTILILGVDGRIGRDLYELLSEDFKIVGTYFSNRKRKAGLYTADILDKKKLAFIVEKTQPDFVINATGLASPDDCLRNKKQAYALNYKIAENVADVCEDKCIIFFYLSTVSVFSGEKYNYIEDDAPDPVNYYGVTKSLGEVVSRKGIILRLPFVIFLSKTCNPFLKKILRSTQLQKVDNSRIRKFLWTYDLYQVIKKIIECGIGSGVYHVCSDEHLSKYKLVKLFLKANCITKKKIKPSKNQKFAKRPKVEIMNNTKIKKIGVKFTNIENIFTSELFNNHR